MAGSGLVRLPHVRFCYGFGEVKAAHVAVARAGFNLSSFNAKCMGLGVVERYFNIYLFQSSSPSLCLCLGGFARARL